jgi:hypothetical protein
MAAGIKASGREMVLMAEGQPDIQTMANDSRTYGGINIRRVGHDINWRWYSICSLIDLTSGLWPFAHNASVSPTAQGFHNQLDILEVGVGCRDGRSGGTVSDPKRGSDFCVANESDTPALNAARAHFGMWSILKASLVLGMDLERITDAELAIIRNKAAIDIQQDPLAAQARRIASVAPAATASEPSPICAAEGTVVEGGSDIPCDNAIVVAKCTDTTHRWKHDAVSGRFFTTDSSHNQWCMLARHGKLASLNDLAKGGLTIPWVEEGAIHAVPCANIDADTTCGQSDSCRTCSNYGVGNGCGSLWDLTMKNGTASISGWGGKLGVNNDYGASGPMPHTRHTCGGCSTGGQLARDRQVFEWVPGLADGAGFSLFRLPASAQIKDDDAVGHVRDAAGSEFCLEIAPAGQLETWTAPLSGGRVAVAFFNRSPYAAPMAVTWEQLGLGAGAAVRVEDAWRNASAAATGSYRDGAVPAHGMALLTLMPQ